MWTRIVQRRIAASTDLHHVCGLAVLLAMVVFNASVAAGQFNPPAASLTCNETLTIDVEIDASVVDLRGFTLTFDFDPTVLEPVAVSPGALLTGATCEYFFTWLNPFPGVNTIEVDAGLLGCSTAGPGSIVRIELRGVTAGQSLLRKIQGSLRDSANQNIPFNPADATIDFDCSVIEFDPLGGSMGCGETLIVEMNVEGGLLDLHGFSLVLEYDPTVIAPVSVEPGPLVTGAACSNFFRWLNSDSPAGTIEVDLGLLGCGVDGPGSILTVVFEGILDGSSFLRCADGARLRDGDNQELLIQCNETTIDYVCPVAAAPIGWGTLKASYR